MKVVLFCGGQGLRMGDQQPVPKPMTPIGYRPIIWHLMRYYAHFGHKDFVLCLGYKADLIKGYFLHYDEALSNDFVMNGATDVQLLSRDIHDWTITFVDTGIHASIGERLRAVRLHLAGEPAFLANYSDGLTDLDLNAYIAHFLSTGATASFLSTRLPQSFHVADIDDDEKVTAINPVNETPTWVNAGFFVFREAIWDHLRPGEDLVEKPFGRLIDREELIAHRYEGFWRPMDTFKDRQILEELHARGDAPWQVWRSVAAV